MPELQSEQSSKSNAHISTPTKAVNKAAIAKAFDNKSPSVKDRVRKWQEQGGGVKATPPVAKVVSGVEQECSQSRVMINDHEATTSSDQATPKQAVHSEDKALEEATKICQNNGDISFKLSSPEIVTKRKQPIKKKSQSVTKLRIAQAIVGPTVRPSQRLRRLSEIQRDAKATEVSDDGQAAELTEYEVREQSNTKEVASPKKRIVSDSHWRQKERSSDNSSDLAHTSSGKALLVEGWLDSVGNDAVHYSMPTGQKNILTTDKLGQEIRQTIPSEEAGRKRRLRRNILNTPNFEKHKPVEHKRSHQDLPELNWLSPNTRDLAGKDGSRPEEGIAASEDGQNPVEIAISSGLVSQLKAAPSEILGSIAKDMSDDLTEHSVSEESDHLTSISRRPRPKHPPQRTRRNIFNHATKFLFGSDSRPESSKYDATETTRLPSIQSWLEHTPDPFTNNNSRFSPEEEDQYSAIKDHEPCAEHADDRAQSEFRAPNSGDNAAATNDYGDLESCQNDCINHPGKKRRIKRVLRHRDGTVTTGDGLDQHIALQDADGISGSDCATNRPATSGRADLAPDERIKFQTPFAGKSSPQRESQRPIVKLDTRQVTITNNSTELLSSERSRQGISNLGKTEGSRGLTRHSDLMSVLSMPTEKGSTLPSARKLQTQTSRLRNTTIEGVLEQFVMEEAKYAQELYTLVEGVIPVLLSEGFTSSDTQATIYPPSSKMNENSRKLVTQGVLDMGIALENLQIQHKQRAFRGQGELLTWVSAILPYYQDYLRVWRLGFQDVMINLAVRGNPGAIHQAEQDDFHQSALQDGFDHDNRVDVTFLLKRPLVRVKNITKTVKCIAKLDWSEEKTMLILQCERLVEEARKKSNEERARIEDESAAKIDATRARDPRTLDLIGNAAIPSHRRVKARDTFDLKFLHSSGQRLDCKVEIYLRDDPSDIGSESDVLISQVDGTGDFLLFPPLSAKNLSARNGDVACEIIVMIREDGIDQFIWYELLSLTADEEDIVSEWIVLLGASPIPPSKRLPCGDVAYHDKQASPTANTAFEDTLPSIGWQVEAPIGERSLESTSPSLHSWPKFPQRKSFRQNPSTILEETPSALAAEADSQPPRIVVATSDADYEHQRTQIHANAVEQMTWQRPLIGYQQLRQDQSSDSTLKRSGAQRRYTMSLNRSLRATSEFDRTERPKELHSPSDLHTSLYEEIIVPDSDDSSKSTQLQKPRPTRYHSSKHYSAGQTATGNSADKPGTISIGTTHRAEPHPVSAMSNLGHRCNIMSTSIKRESVEISSTASDGIALLRHRQSDMDPILPPGAENGPKRLHRRMSSPLKHEYAPSSVSGSVSNPESPTSRQDVSSRSDSSDSDCEDDTPSVLVPMFAVRRYRKTPRTTPPESLADNTLSPSQSVSQAPYRSVPVQPGKRFRTIAMISAWSSQGRWESLWPRDCLVVISPGLIEAYELSGTKLDSKSTSSEGLWSKKSSNPLIGLELTPLVPIRRGTALDISIRSPPTSDSMITATSSHNFLFRSPNAEQCELLYLNINHSRINNPTYIALQNARATSFTPHFQSVQQSSETGDSGSLSWFGLGRRRKSYRAAGAPAPSVSRNTESSVSSLASAFSALRNFGRIGTRFNIAKSTISSRHGNRSEDDYMTSEYFGQEDAAVFFKPIPRGNDGALGLSNCKIRLYMRESTTRWLDLGSARLAILRPYTNIGTPTQTSLDTSNLQDESASVQTHEGRTSGGKGDLASATSLKEFTSPGNKASSDDKRILITTSSQTVLSISEKSRTLLDVTLGETCFERVARTGIAVSVWENFEGGMVAKQGGVVGGKLRVYMMQFKNEADTAYTYSIVGKLRY